MDVKDFDAILMKTLDDGAMSRSEETALSMVVSELLLGRSKRAVLRARAFDVAARGLESTDTAKRLLWLKKVLNILERSEEETEGASPEALFSPGEACRQRICGAFESAKSNVDVCVFTITDDRITESILKAHQKRVKIRIVTDNDKSEDLGSDIERLAAAGISVAIDRTPFHMHHKFAIFDQRVLLNGSYNWTRGAAQENEENVVLHSDQALVRAFSTEFNRLWAKFFKA